MARVRPAVYAALLLVLLVAASAVAAIPPEVPLAAVGWPASTTLVVAEVVTGGASALDEYIELANAGTAPADLAGLEVVYATSSGATVTKKAGWTVTLRSRPGSTSCSRTAPACTRPAATPSTREGWPPPAARSRSA